MLLGKNSKTVLKRSCAFEKYSLFESPSPTHSPIYRKETSKSSLKSSKDNSKSSLKNKENSSSKLSVNFSGPHRPRWTGAKQKVGGSHEDVNSWLNLSDSPKPFLR